MRKMFTLLALVGASLNVSAEGCLGLAPSARQACFDKIVANTPEPTPEQKKWRAERAVNETERYKRLDDEMRVRDQAKARVAIQRYEAEQAALQRQNEINQITGAISAQQAPASSPLLDRILNGPTVQQPASTPAHRTIVCTSTGRGNSVCN